MVDISWFERLQWQSDRVILPDLVFFLQHHLNESGKEALENSLVIYKTKKLVDQYAHFWSHYNDFESRNILELGLWDGGSLLFWFDLFQPEKYVGIDLKDRTDGEAFRVQCKKKQIENRIATYWNTNQMDGTGLRAICKAEFSGTLDLVIDDASHQYDPTKKSFEILFPLLREGGLYIIEDWAWGHWPEFRDPDSYWARQQPLTRFIFELIEASGTSTELIRALSIYEGFIVAERGPQVVDLEQFRLDQYTLPLEKKGGVWERMRRRLKQRLKP